MTRPTYAVLVRLESTLEREELERIMNERAPEFRAIEGLVQKYYLKDMGSDQYGGFYLWRSLDDVASYRASDLAATIGQAYRGVGEPQIDVFEIVMPLRD